MKQLARAPAERAFPERIVVVDIAPPGAPRCELEIVPECEEGEIGLATAIYVRERKRLSRRQNFAGAVFAVAVVAAHCFGFIG